MGKENKKLIGKAKDISNADNVVVYGYVDGDIVNCENVIIINGYVDGEIINCNHVLGLLSDKSIGRNALLNKEKSGVYVSSKDYGTYFNKHIPENRGRYGR